MASTIDRCADLLNRLLRPADVVLLGRARLETLLGELARLRGELADERRDSARLKASIPAAVEDALTPYVRKLEARLAESELERSHLAKSNRKLLAKLRWHWAAYPTSAEDWAARPGLADPVAERRKALQARLVDMLSAPQFADDDRRVTVVVTSCDRHDLLARTLDSFFQANAHPLEKVIVVEDGDRPFAPELRARFAAWPMDWFHTGERIGQVRAIDAAYARVGTPFVFHMEDDWAFLQGGFIEASMPILEAEPLCLQVWLRGHASGFAYQSERQTAAVRWRRVEVSGTTIWHGFSFTPGLKRLRDYRLLGAYSDHVEDRLGQGGLAEGQLSELYASLGFFAAALWTLDGRPHVEHLGYGRRVG